MFDKGQKQSSMLSCDSSYWLKFLFISLYLLNLLMDLNDNWHVVRHWFKVLCCAIIAHMSDLEFKVTDFRNIILKCLLKYLRTV